MTRIAAISQQIWDMKYRLKDDAGRPVDRTIADSWERVATALAAVEQDPDHWRARFVDIMQNFRFLPAGRILAGAGSGRQVTLFNCFVMGTIPDDMAGIFEHLKEAALTMQQGGGIGYDFSTIRPKGAPVRSVGSDASGPLSFMDVWDAMCRTIMSAGSRRGAMMATLSCDHPDILAFIEAKRDPGRLRMFNLSVLVTDAFIQAVREDAPWELEFEGTVYDSIQARDLWDRIMRATYSYAEPGVIFIDRINQRNNLHYCETISATNPCGEQPLPPYGACLLGSVNLARLVVNPFQNDARIDAGLLDRIVRDAIRMMDNTIDVSNYPLPEQKQEAMAKRRIGLGVTGLADALIMCGARYGGARAVQLAETWLHAIQRSAYLASIEIAKEKGPFPLFEKVAYMNGETIRGLDRDIRDGIAEHGIRNALVTSIAPTGTISLLADNVSSGLEPVFSFSYKRNILMPDGSRREEQVSDYAYRMFRKMYGDEAKLPDSFVDAQSLSPGDHVAMQAAVQKYVDSSISKTINCPVDISFEDFKDVYMKAWDSGCKGCTTYRPNDITGSVLSVEEAPTPPEGLLAPEPPQPAPTIAAATPEPELPLERPQARPVDRFDAGGVVYMTQPLGRPEELPGATYKLKWPDSPHSMYITINDILQDGRRRPFEVFVNSKNMEHFAWTVALTRMISAVFRRGGDVSFVVEELKAVFDPRGGQWMNGRYVPSLLAAIGDVIERHMIDIGFIPKPGAETDEREADRKRVTAGHPHDHGEAAEATRPSAFRQCPQCGGYSLKREEGCDACVDCGYSKCG
jgi:ribonucleoside-diphosphate reductase alpha chain